MGGIKVAKQLIHACSVDLAKEIGLERAMMLHQFSYWVNINEANKRNFHDGKYWTYNSFNALQELFPYWSISTVKRLVASLLKDGYLLQAHHASNWSDRTNWYTVDYSVWPDAQSQIEPVSLAQSEPVSLDQIEPMYINKVTQSNNIVRETSFRNNSLLKEQLKTTTSAPFTPPTLQEVSAYCLERANGVDPNKWHDFYTSKGWMVGKNKMKDWKAAVRTWEQSTNQPVKWTY